MSSLATSSAPPAPSAITSDLTLVDFNTASAATDFAALRQDFPFLSRQPGLVYFDSAATSLLPQEVIAAEQDYYLLEGGASPFRGSSAPSQQAAQSLHQAKDQIAAFFGAKNRHELILTQNSTAALNGVARGWGEANLRPGHKIILSVAEHHSNLVPWQKLAATHHLELLWLPVDRSTGQLDLHQLRHFLADPAVRLLTLTHMSNVLGVLNPLPQITAIIKKAGRRGDVRCCVDGAQTAAYFMDNFARSQVDFYAFSGHKMFAAPHIGGLLVREELLQSGEFQPWIYGGGMVQTVTQERTRFSRDLEKRFQPGTVNVPGVVSLAAATRFLDRLGRPALRTYLAQLAQYAFTQLQTIPHLHFVCAPASEDALPETVTASVLPGTTTPLTSFPATTSTTTNPLPTPSFTPHLLTFYFDHYHPADVANYLDLNSFALRFGDHCAQPLYQFLSVAPPPPTSSPVPPTPTTSTVPSVPSTAPATHPPFLQPHPTSPPTPPRHLLLSGALRLSLAPYNTPAEIDALVATLRQLPTHLN